MIYEKSTAQIWWREYMKKAVIWICDSIYDIMKKVWMIWRKHDENRCTLWRNHRYSNMKEKWQWNVHNTINVYMKYTMGVIYDDTNMHIMVKRCIKKQYEYCHRKRNIWKKWNDNEVENKCHEMKQIAYNSSWKRKSLKNKRRRKWRNNEENSDE